VSYLKINIKMSTLNALKACGEVDAELHIFLTSTLVELLLNCLKNIYKTLIYVPDF
jgi:hypothetical protein